MEARGGTGSVVLTRDFGTPHAIGEGYSPVEAHHGGEEDWCEGGEECIQYVAEQVHGDEVEELGRKCAGAAWDEQDHFQKGCDEGIVYIA